MPECRTIGKSATRVDALQKVTGTAFYVDDLKLPGMLYGKALRSPVPAVRRGGGGPLARSIR